MATTAQKVLLHTYSPLVDDTHDHAVSAVVPQLTGHKARDYRFLRIALIALSAVATLLSLADGIMDVVILANANEYVRTEKSAHEQYDESTYQATVDDVLDQVVIVLFFIVSLTFNAYNFITFLVCMIFAIVAPRRLLVARCSAAVCLLITTIIGFVMSVYTSTLYCLKLTEPFQPPGGVAIVCSIIILAYTIVQLVATCFFTVLQDTRTY